MHRLPFFILFFGAMVQLCLPGSSQANLSEYIRKYRSTAVSSEALERLNHYNHLIDYFTSFSYFRPRYRVSADFIRALILAESGADPNAVSSKNAIGLGQIILTTGQMAARDLYGSSTHFRYVSKERLRDLSRDDLFDPATNILLTCYLIAKYNHMFDGRLDLVISAWNAGENTSSLAIGQHAPYLETKDLIGKVNGYYIFLLKQKGALRY
ncbi:lytic transglycosylase domain-containing protein [Desulfopila aestuarii]|uniref:Transglycosylase SLT domain-containing protein n=1 Tax=Desulfopila aestuarii DSM 18488 TaxID=1121416 RepID=A0A1M7Y166_9BACT|nr:transglycosylase SLT domain-containing protein [Desulfopila aestuarii]SHO45481.1 Transglycosylase SLT domain-containing protein [Desulfopila aestuarii DSM 18488]